MMRAAWLEIDLDAYRRNLSNLARWTGSPVIAVVKANAYGHGLVQVARAAGEAGARACAVALPLEGAELRAAGWTGRILLIGLTLEEEAPLIALHGLEPVISRPEMAAALSKAARARGAPLPVHVKVDTGMCRAGLEPAAALRLCEQVAADPDLELAGVATHFASAEDQDLSRLDEQWGLFAPLVRQVRARWPRAELHAANSAAGLWFQPARLDAVRAGLVTYGIPPAPRALPFAVEPVASLKAKLVQVREFPAGCRVGYGGTWVTPAASRLAIVPLGYADGYPWSAGNRAWVLLHGQTAPVRGRICMDQMIVDVTEIPAAAPGDTAVLIGKSGDEQVTVEQVAAWGGTITYEIVTRWSERLPRQYMGEASGSGVGTAAARG